MVNISEVKVSAAGVITLLQSASLRGGKSCNMSVGFSSEHAIYVHEDTTAYHEQGQAKYLEAPSRSPIIQQLMMEAVSKALKNKRSIKDALIAAGNILLRASMDLVPVDTGELRDSGFVNVVEIG